MWNRTTLIHDGCGLADRKKNLLTQLRTRYEIPEAGVALVFDAEDYGNDRFYKGCWGVSALHMDIKDGGIQEISPSHLLRLMESGDYSDLVWLSKYACEQPNLAFAWILSHEFRHLQQNRMSLMLSKATYFMRFCLHAIDIEPKTTDQIPAELDADLSAWHTCREVFGNAKSDGYVSSSVSAGDRPEDFKLILEHGLEAQFEVVGATIEFLRQHKSQMENAQTKAADDTIKTFDVEGAIRELLLLVP